jgi:hypothetical protein
MSVATAAEPSRPTFPLWASGDGRYLEDAAGRPFFYHADTAWQLPKRLTHEEITKYLDSCVSRGFTAIQVQAFSKEVTPLPNRDGEVPFDAAENILKPNERYWRTVDFVLTESERRGLFVALAPLWIRWGGDDKQGWRGHLTEQNAGPYGEFLGQRYARFNHLMWILGGDADPKEKTEAIHRLARGIKRHAPHHLLSVHNAPGHASAEFFNDSPWLDVNLAYTYREVSTHVLAEYRRTPARPIILGESGYEEESNDQRGGNPWRMRRQAYAAVLSGALGGHAFGQRHVWRFDEQWADALKSPASKQMAHVKALFTSKPWHQLVPDEALVVGERARLGSVEFISAARAAEGSFAIIYFPTNRTVKLNLVKLRGALQARWFDPTDGASRPIVDFSSDDSLTASISSPAKNSAGDPDWVLILEAAP